MSDSLTIALPISSFLPNLGGMEVGLHNIAVRLKALGHRPIVIAPASHVGRLKKEGWNLPYEVCAFPPKVLTYLHKYPRLSFFVFNVFFSWLQSRYRFDVWHVTMGYPLGPAIIRFADGRDDIRYLIRCAGDDIQVFPDIGYGMRLNPVIDGLVRQYFPHAQMLTAISDSVADEYRALGVAENQIRYIPNGVDLDRFMKHQVVQDVRTRNGLDENDFLFLCVGRNHPKKNYRSLIKAAAILEQNTSMSFQVAIVGRGVEELQVDVELSGNPPVHLISEIGDTRLPGKVPDVPGQRLIDLYKSADAFVFPSLMETFGIAIVEAMAAGLPVIVGDAPGCRDIVQKGVYGLMVSPSDPEDISHGMLHLLEDVTLRENLSAKSKQRCSDFSWDCVVEQYCDLYQELITN